MLRLLRESVDPERAIFANSGGSSRRHTEKLLRAGLEFAKAFLGLVGFW